MQNETDRGVALVAAAFLDDVVEALLHAALVNQKPRVDKLFRYPGALSTFAARSDLAYAMGLLGPKMHSDLTTIRDIRNLFGHSHRLVSFSEPSIEKMCRELEESYLSHLLLAPRHKFITKAIILADQIILRGLSLTHAQVGEDFRLDQFVRVTGSKQT